MNKSKCCTSHINPYPVRQWIVECNIMTYDPLELYILIWLLTDWNIWPGVWRRQRQTELWLNVYLLAKKCIYLFVFVYLFIWQEATEPPSFGALSFPALSSATWASSWATCLNMASSELCSFDSWRIGFIGKHETIAQPQSRLMILEVPISQYERYRKKT